MDVFEFPKTLVSLPRAMSRLTCLTTLYMWDTGPERAVTGWEQSLDVNFFVSQCSGLGTPKIARKWSRSVDVLASQSSAKAQTWRDD